MTAITSHGLTVGPEPIKPGVIPILLKVISTPPQRRCKPASAKGKKKKKK